MNIRASKPLSGAAAAAPRRDTMRGCGGDPAGAGNGAGTSLDLLSIPEAELTPRVRNAVFGLMGEVERLREQLEQSRARIAYLERLADEDALMPVANRRGFLRELSRMMSFAQRYGTPSSIVYLDVNGLKQINDRYGHAAGDAALQHVARVLVDNVRNSDVVGRLGGDEFAVLLVQSDQAAAKHKAATLVEAIEARPLLWRGQEIPISAACGTQSFTGTENAADALDAADRAMYDNKRRRRAGEAG